MDQANLLDMLAVIDEECRYNQAAALVAFGPAQREMFARRARQGAAVVRRIRHEIANARSRRRINACIERLLDAEITICRTSAEPLDPRQRRGA